MSKKKRYFVLLNSLLIFLILFSFLYFQKQENVFVLFALSTLGVAIYIILSNSLVDELLKVEKNLEEKIQKSLHEINTPVSTIQINTQMLKQKLKDPKNLNRLDRIQKASDELLKLYEEMEYFLKEKMDIVDKKVFDLKEAIIESAKKFEDIKKDTNIIINIPKDTYIKADRIGFIKTMDNLIQNAIKHNKNLSKIEILLKDNILYIKDDGEGIKTQDIYNVFNKYFQDHKARGFGLGLSIVKEFCDKNNIDIKISSSNKGTTFKLNLKRQLV